MKMPNLRGLFIPDDGYTLFEVDFSGADARVVAWEADDTALKKAFRDGVDIHNFNALTIWPQAQGIAGVIPTYRQRAKIAVHAVDYVCKANTLAEHIQCSQGEARTFIAKWFAAHPAILDWHHRIDRQLANRRFVHNVWGYRRTYFDRTENLLPEALAWIGQSTTAIAINKLIVALAGRVWAAQILLQTHDSVTFQIPTHLVEGCMPTIWEVCDSISLPYPDPCPMPCSISASTESWGSVKPLRQED